MDEATARLVNAGLISGLVCLAGAIAMWQRVQWLWRERAVPELADSIEALRSLVRRLVIGIVLFVASCLAGIWIAYAAEWKLGYGLGAGVAAAFAAVAVYRFARR